MQLCTSLAIKYLYCISSRCYVFVQEAIKDFEFEFEHDAGNGLKDPTAPIST